MFQSVVGVASDADENMTFDRNVRQYHQEQHRNWRKCYFRGSCRWKPDGDFTCGDINLKSLDPTRTQNAPSLLIVLKGRLPLHLQ
jgi:hypothetical protein